MNTGQGKIIVFGEGGQVGSALKKQLGVRALIFGQADADFAMPESLAGVLEAAIRAHGPIAAVINAAAYTAVDQAETERDISTAINGVAPGVLARICAEHGIPFVHYSTDYVYSGDGNTAWTEESPVAPQNAYGRGKLQGEMAVVEIAAAKRAPFLILRTSWVYDATGKNFLNTMLRSGSERETLKIVGDQTGAPTYASDLAAMTLKMLEKAQKMPEFPSGIYNVCNSGETTWWGFANAIFAEAKTALRDVVVLKVQSVLAIPSSEYPTPAKRPLNSRLNMDKLKRIFDLEMRDWSQALKSCLSEKAAMPSRVQK